jgi:hypothetical protein
MKHLQLFEDYLGETSGREVANWVKDITPESSDIPDFFIDTFIKPNKWEKKEIDPKELLKTDPSFKEYFDSGEIRYQDDEVDPDDIYLPIVVFNGVILDGYSRVSKTIRNGSDEKMDAYVNTTEINKEQLGT